MRTSVLFLVAIVGCEPTHREYAPQLNRRPASLRDENRAAVNISLLPNADMFDDPRVISADEQQFPPVVDNCQCAQPHQIEGVQCVLDFTDLQALPNGEPELTIPCIDVVPSGGHFAGVSYSRESFVPFGSMSGSHVLEAHMYSNVAGDVATLANLFDAPMVQSTKPMAEEFSGGEVFISLTSTPFISLNTYTKGHIELTIWYWP